MMMRDSFIQELEQEAKTTRRVLERVPESHLGWKPHPTSMSMGQLAMHVAMVPGAVAQLSVPSTCGVPTFTQPVPASASELLPAFEQSIATARSVLANFDDAALGETWRMMNGEQQVMAMPRAALLRSVMLNHWYHHRGQLAVYLRQCGVPVPSIYGPSGDENPFANAAAAASAAKA
jgi:uncharacterized damage-inducible protein DinB